MAGGTIYWHVHNDILLEWWPFYEEHIQYMRDNETSEKIEYRITLFKPIKGNIPNSVIKATENYKKVWGIYGKSWKVFEKAVRDDYLSIMSLHSSECSCCHWTDKQVFKMIFNEVK